MRQPSPWTGLSPLKVVGGTLRTSEHPGAEENIVILNRPKLGSLLATSALSVPSEDKEISCSLL